MGWQLGPRRAVSIDIAEEPKPFGSVLSTEALPLLEIEGIDSRVYYIASAELFDLLPAEQREALFPEEHALEAIGISGFTLPTMYRWVRSDAGRGAPSLPKGPLSGERSRSDGASRG